MADRTIPSLPPAISLTGNEMIAGVQAGVDVRFTTAQVVGLATSLSSALFVEQLNVSALNTVSSLTFAPKNNVVMLVVNGTLMAFNMGAAASFTVTAQAVHWTSSLYDLQTTDTVYAVYGV